MAKSDAKRLVTDARRHTFKSFRDRVESIKIDPNLKLNRRAYDDVDSSFFAASFEHWKEVNLSKNFTEFVDEVDSYTQTLTQIIHHQEKIYKCLHSRIEKNDGNSLQPLLELLAQFIHDMGEDFLIHYDECIQLLLKVALDTSSEVSLNKKSSSNALEWIFSCLAFIFKYLARNLTNDLIPTFEILSDVLVMTKKAYISRFCAEALSFLLRKSKVDCLNKLIQHSFMNRDCLLDSSKNYSESLIVLFTEAMKTTQGSLHSKSSLILSCLFENILAENECTAEKVSILSDIILDVIDHGDLESCKVVFFSTIKYVERALESSQSVMIISACQLLSCLAFAGSGRKVPSWSVFMGLCKTLEKRTCSLMSEMNQEHKEALMRFISFLFSIIIRNCEANILSSYQSFIFGFLMSCDKGYHFLGFVDSNLKINETKVSGLGILQHTQTFINKLEESNYRGITHFFSIHENGFATNLYIPESIQRKVEDELTEIITHSDFKERMEEIYWRMALLSLAGRKTFTEWENMISLVFFSGKQLNKTLFGREIVSNAVAIVASSSKSEKQKQFMRRVFRTILSDLDEYRQSCSFMAALKSLMDNDSYLLNDLTLKEMEDFMMAISYNLSQPSHNIRLATLDLLIIIRKALGQEPYQTTLQARIIEEIPLSLNTGRDIILRVRNMAQDFSKVESSSGIEQSIIIRFLFGLLTNRFQPCWEAVHESIPLLIDSCPQFIWNISYEFLSIDLHNYNNNVANIEKSEESDKSIQLVRSFAIRDNRYNDIFNSLDSCLKKYYTINDSLMSDMLERRGNNTYNEMMFEQVIKVLSLAPNVAEKNSKWLVPLVLKDQESGELEENESEGMDGKIINLRNRNKLLTVLVKFKNLHNVFQSEKLYAHMLVLLCNKKADVQKMAFEVLLNWKVKVLRKYKDRLSNLLDDTLFRDELTSLFVEGSDSKIEEEDMHELVPFIMRILYGRIQGSPKSKSKAGKKLAILNSLPSLSSEYVFEFVRLGYQRIPLEDFFKHGIIPKSDIKLLGKMIGFVSLLDEICDTLGYKYPSVLKTTVEPLILSLIVAQKTVEEPGIEVMNGKVARNIRQIGMKCLGEILNYVKSDFNWAQYLPLIHERVLKPRFFNFAEENLQQVSYLMKILMMSIENRNLESLMYLDDFSAARSISSILLTFKAKDTVVNSILNFCVAAFKQVDDHQNDEDYYTMLAIFVEALLNFLPFVLERSSSTETSAKAIELTLIIIRSQYINERSVKSTLLHSLTAALERPVNQVANNDKTKILLSLSSLIDSFDSSFDEILPAYLACSKALKNYSDATIRESLCLVLRTIGVKFTEFEAVSSLVESLNAFSSTRMNEPDFGRRLSAYRTINEDLYESLSPLQWTPILNCALFFINDDKELALRENSSLVLSKFVDAYSHKDTLEHAKPFISELKNLILPNIRLGIRSKEESVRSEYISVLSHIIQYSKYFTELDDMRVLITKDEDTNFFKNIIHIQLHRRQRCIKRLSELKGDLSSGSVAHYILPIIENYSICYEDKYRNITNETLEAMCSLVRCVTWTHFKAIIKRYLSQLTKSKKEHLKDMVNRLVSVSRGLMTAIIDSHRGEICNMSGELPPSPEIERFIIREMIPPISKVLNHRDDETIVARTPLAEALIYLISCSTDDFTESTLPGLLTSVCQVLRSRSEELRDAVRKTLARICSSLGPRYFNFILNELKSALSRGSQIHVLSYTVHFLLVTLAPKCQLGDLNESAANVVGIVMEDVFGAAGEEKDAEGYTSKMKEVKFKKSFDSGEILSANINFSFFGILIHPIKLLLLENVSLKTQNKIDELLRRFALGLNHNQETESNAILHLSYELYKQSSDVSHFPGGKRELKENEKHFMVQLSRNSNKIGVDTTKYSATLQKFSLDILRTAITRHNDLLTAPNLEAFVPILEKALQSDDESLMISGLRVLNIIVKLPFGENTENVFKSCSRRTINIVKDCPTTNSELCQASLRFLATIVRHKSTIELKDSAIAYVLIRIQPDLEEHNKQGLAFNFLKSVVAKHIVIPEVYDTMDKASKIMVVNHAREIRDMARSIYFQFIMEYDQGRGRLEKQLKFLVNNLSYPTTEGRSSVMELLNLIVVKSNPDLLEKVASSFFVALANITVNDESSRCREMASELIATVLRRLGKEKAFTIEKYCFSWLEQSSNELLKRCGFNIYKILITVFGLDERKELFTLVLDNIVRNLTLSRKNEFNDQSISWQSVYLSLQLFSSICSQLKAKAFEKSYERVWLLVGDCLLYPHSWVRLISGRLIHLFLAHLGDVKFEFTEAQTQNIASKLLRQLGAPSITNELGEQIVKNLVRIAMKWNSENTLFHKYVSTGTEGDNLEEDVNDNDFPFALDFLVSRVCNVIKIDDRKVSLASKKSSIQLAAMLVQVIDVNKLNVVIEKVLLALYNYIESDTMGEQEAELKDLSTECTDLIKERIGITEYLNIYNSVSQTVKARRQERRAKRFQLSVTAPEIAARRKLKKHERSREKRKHEKDTNGYYIDKKRAKRSYN